MTELLPLGSGSAGVTGSAAAPLLTGLFAYAIATTAYILIGLRLGEPDTVVRPNATDDVEARKES